MLLGTHLLTRASGTSTLMLSSVEVCCGEIRGISTQERGGQSEGETTWELRRYPDGRRRLLRLVAPSGSRGVVSDRRVVFLRCGEFQPPSGGWGWRHIIGRQHPGQLGWDQDYFMWAMQQTVQGADPKDQSNGTLLYYGPILTIRFEKAAGSYFRDEYSFKVVVIRRNGDVLTAYGDYLRTTNCQTIERCKEYP